MTLSSTQVPAAELTTMTSEPGNASRTFRAVRPVSEATTTFLMPSSSARFLASSMVLSVFISPWTSK
jgi:hypothetical protein